VTVPGACNNTVGNTAITRVSGSFVDDGVKEGMHTTHPSFLASDYVVSVTPSTVTMSGNSSAGFVNATVTWLPMVDVDATPGAAGYATSAVHLLGQTLPTAAAASLTMEVERYGDRFWFLCGNSATTINLLWATGASAVTNAAFVFGNDRGANSGNTRNHPCRFARGDRERIADGYQDLYGPRPEEQITADWIREETTAVELRNRLFDLSAQPRVIVRFASFRTPDLRRMQVISFASDLDSVVAYPKYGSDGSWSGKRFRVLEVEQNMGPQFHTEILAVEAD
jgi:hypothetical protein